MMKKRNVAVMVGALTLSAVATVANAYEFGSSGWAQKPGIVLGAAAAAPPPGLYGFDQVFTYQSNLVGPGAPVNPGGASTGVKADVFAQGLLWVPGWNFLGATYDVVGVVPFISASVGPPMDANPSGMHNMFLARLIRERAPERLASVV
ncbi:hypothetical protein [Bradyrhizobium sp. USDA 241]|uniref:hypothetical protein n=1 Tax=Bradyrhizobium sp. USDA 241 TaxID=3377725 RepID=UPI003C77F7DF